MKHPDRLFFEKKRKSILAKQFIGTVPLTLAMFLIGLMQICSGVAADAQQASNVQDQRIDSYNSLLSGSAVYMTDQNYAGNYVADVTGPPDTFCGTASFCDKHNIANLLSLVQQKGFSFIPPISLPQSGQELLTEIRDRSSCKNLGFMNVMRDPGSTQNNSVPLRPTRDFMIYQLPIQGRDILLVRGDDYQLAWPFWGADKNGVHLPNEPSQLRSHGPDFLFEIDAKSCMVINTFNLFGLHKKQFGTLSESSFSEPINIHGDLIILAMTSSKIPRQTPIFTMWLIQLDQHTGFIKGKLFYSTYFKD